MAGRESRQECRLRLGLAALPGCERMVRPLIERQWRQSIAALNAEANRTWGTLRRYADLDPKFLSGRPSRWIGGMLRYEKQNRIRQRCTAAGRSADQDSIAAYPPASVRRRQ